MWYCGSGSKRNGVGIVLKNDYVDSRVIQKISIFDFLMGHRLI